MRHLADKWRHTFRWAVFSAVAVTASFIWTFYIK